MRALQLSEVQVVSGSGLLLDMLLQNPLTDNALLDIDLDTGRVGSLSIHINLLLVGINLDIGWALFARDAELPAGFAVTDALA
jgi:hypothetical protein